MLHWISSVANAVSGAASRIWRRVTQLVASVYVWVNARIAVVQHDLDRLYHVVSGLASSIGRFIGGEFSTFARWVASRLSAIENSVLGITRQLAREIRQSYNLSLKILSALRSLGRNLYANLQKWVIADVYNPLMADISSALAWIRSTGSYLSGLFANPDRIVLLLWPYFLSRWLYWVNRLSAPAMRYFLKHAMSVAPQLATVMEDLITRVLLWR